MYCQFELDVISCIPTEVIVDMSEHLILPTKEEINKAIEENKATWYSWTKFYGDLEKCVVIAHKHGYTIKLPALDTEQINPFLHEMMNKIDKLNEKHVNAETPYEGKYFSRENQVHIPGNKLLNITEVKVIEDACTHAVQDMLDDKYRILAVCQQPDQRRPDYIMGRIVLE